MLHITRKILLIQVKQPAIKSATYVYEGSCNRSSLAWETRISISGGNRAVSCSHYPVTLYLAVVFILETL